MRIWLNKYFDFTKREFNGLMVLIILIGLTMLFPYVFDWIYPLKADSVTDVKALHKLKVSANPDVEGVNADLPQIAYHKDLKKKDGLLFEFDPNSIEVTGWQKLGLSEKQSLSIVKYLSKGGHFRKPEDLKKMYTISPSMYIRLLPFVRIVVSPTSPAAGMPFDNSGSYKLDPELKVKPSYLILGNNTSKATFHVFNRVNNKKPIVTTMKIVELNGADTLLLDEIKGIGPAFARRIVKYRDRLGGFYKIEQLLEVFGLDSSKFEEVKGQVRVDDGMIKKININTAAVKDFNNHPYIRYKQVNALIEYRKQHGNYANIADVKKVSIITPEVLANLGPYLSF
jgi:competence protein ComEA